MNRLQFAAFLFADMFRSTGFGLQRVVRPTRSVGGWVLGLLHTPMDLVLLWGGRCIAIVQILLGVGHPGRAFTPEEQAWIFSMFGPSLQVEKIRLCEGPLGLLGITQRAFVLGNVIYLPGRVKLSVLVHELVHVWQYQQSGLGYLTRALWAQWFGQGYDFERGLRAGKTFDTLNPEQQAQWVQTLFEKGMLWQQSGAQVLSRLQKGGCRS